MDDEEEELKLYYVGAIDKLLSDCCDIELMELILKILQKSKL